MGKKLSQEEIINRFKKTHGDRYDYSRFVYINASTESCIVCPEHGEFYQQPRMHANGQGCPVCAHKARQDTCEEKYGIRLPMNAPENREKSKQTWLDKYGVDNPMKDKSIQEKATATYLKNHIKLPTNKVKRSKRKRKPFPLKGKPLVSREEWLSRFAKVHGDKYDYSHTGDILYSSKIKIYCPDHGFFYQGAGAHAGGQACPVCTDRCALGYDEFVKRAKEIHGDKYDYSKVDYVNNKTKITVVCPKHGEFEVTPHNHLRGRGCFLCGRRQRNISVKKESSYEMIIYNELCDIFGEDDVIQEYESDERYPFFCDFYIKSRDMFIEVNIHWTHGEHWFNELDEKDLDRLNDLKSKSSSKYYENAVKVWSERDVRKRLTAMEHTLNYITFWDKSLEDFYGWVDAGCPDSKDWIQEYEWMNYV